jgi:DNA primase
MQFSRQIIQEVQDRNPIEEVLSEFLDLKKSGKNYKAKCPFHHDKTPSFYVSPEKGLYHCFGCGRSGNVFTFLEEYKGMSFPEAVKFLAERAGIQLTYKESHNSLYRVTEFAKDIYHSVLLRETYGKPGIAYLKSRGIKKEIIEKFTLGFAPSSGNFLLKKARLNNIKEDGLLKVGLAVRDEAQIRDKFRKRVIFPIRDTSGRVIGFGGRIVGEGMPKYMNSPETEIYKKAKSLYGLYESREWIRREKEVILVEGYTDLTALWQGGIKNVVASLGTSLTQEQAKLLSRYTKRVVLLYDSDEAGVKAAARGVDILLSNSLSVSVCVLPVGYDPDKFIREKGENLLVRLIRNSSDFLDFKIKLCKNETPDSKINLIRGIGNSMKNIQDPITREVWLQEAEKRLGIKRELLSEPPPTPPISRHLAPGKREKVEARILGLAMRDNEVMNILKKELTPDSFVSQGVKNLMLALLRGENTGETIGLVNGEERSIITGILLGGESKKESLKEARDLICKIKFWILDEKIKEMKENIKKRKERGESVKSILPDYENLIRERQLKK